MDIITLPIEHDKEKIESKYRLVVIAAQRARELSLGAEPRLQLKTGKVTTTALLETISNSIEFITGDEAAVAREQAEKMDFRKMIEDKRRPMEDLSDLEKDLKVYLHEKEATEKALEELFIEGEDREESEE
ncbi:MAG TPA: DNA-directed RNA polymerase subunit omega [Dissulfurispiraceae bacterium]|nr:DNA-directed RNA polymerase subunit omega [Dissulfurispiraceae bacterium]